jgi:hypothetical protein
MTLSITALSIITMTLSTIALSVLLC